MPTVAETIAGAIGRLQPVTETPRLDAEILLAHAMNLSRAQLLARLRDTVPAAASGQFDTLLARRLAHEPIAYILGHWEFFSLDLITRAPMLVPRPETEHLVEVALERLRARLAEIPASLPPGGPHAVISAQDGLPRPPRLLDLCTGTGCVAVAVARNAPRAEVAATDLNPAALALARENAVHHNVTVQFWQGDLFGALPQGTEPFDIIVANPPYVAATTWERLDPVIRLHEDPIALLAGEDGLDIIRRIIPGARTWLQKDGVLAMELGEDQFEAVKTLMEEAGYVRVHFRRDLAGHKRIIFGEWDAGTDADQS